MLPTWQSPAEGELDIERVIRRSRVRRSISLLSQIAVGLGLGCFAAEAYIWLRTGAWGSPLIFEVYRSFHAKLPHSNWPGLARLLDWVLVQPLALCAGALLLTLAAILRQFANMIGRWRLPILSERLQAKQPVLPPAAPDQRTLFIEEAYRKLDAVDEVSEPARHPSEHQ